MKIVTPFNEIYSAVAAIYTIGKSVTTVLMNKYREQQIEDSVYKITEDDIDAILKDNLDLILSSKSKEIKDENYDAILDYKFKEKVTKEIIEKEGSLRIYQKDIEKYIQGFIDTVLAYLKGEADDQKVLETVIKLNHITEHNADVRKEEIKEEIRRVVYTALNGRKEEKLLQLRELPFEIEDMLYTAELYSGRVEHELRFALNKKNYKIKLEDVFVATESKTGLWSFYNYVYFWLNGCSTNQNIKFKSSSVSMRKIDLSAIVAFFMVYDRTNYYIRIFGDTDNLYYEQLTKEEYKESREQYRKKYNDATKRDSGYEDWRKYYASVVYTDFGR